MVDHYLLFEFHNAAKLKNNVLIMIIIINVTVYKS